MTKIELIYDRDCPNVETARAHLKQALAELALEPKVTEWVRTQASAPPYVQRYGSPTILVDGRPIGKGEEEEGNACSIYQDGNGNIARTPSVGQIRDAMQMARQRRKKQLAKAAVTKRRKI